jgi:hypothetical protein
MKSNLPEFLPRRSSLPDSTALLPTRAGEGSADSARKSGSFVPKTEQKPLKKGLRNGVMFIDQLTGCFPNLFIPEYLRTYMRRKSRPKMGGGWV